MSDKTVRVSGTVIVNWTAYLPPGSKPNVCADPAVEAVLGSIDQVHDVYVWGLGKAAVHVDLEIDEADVEVEDDDREAP